MKWIYLIIFLIITLPGCIKNTTYEINPDLSKTEDTSELGGNAYPPPESVGEEIPYPPPHDNEVMSGYSDPVEDELPEVETNHFRIISPLKEGDMQIQGEGPEEIPLEIIDITISGVVLGSGIINKKGTFVIHLTSPLIPNHLIGIQLGVQRENINWDELWALRGPNARSIPNLGYFFDTAITEPLD